MNQTKRVVIISPYLTTQDNIKSLVGNYVKSNFGAYSGNIILQTFLTIDDSYRRGAQIGKGGEIIVISDKHNLSSRSGGKDDLRRLQSLEAGIQGLCREKGIPYLEYLGEIERGVRETFLERIDQLKGQIKSRLEFSDFFIE